jgi:hypothetical protein
MKVTDLINEMARADLEGAEEAIKSGDLDKVASHYVKKAKERGLDAKKIVSGLGATFRTFEELDKDQISELKTKVKALIAGELPPKKEKKSKKEKEEEEPEEEEGESTATTAAKASTKAKQKTVLLKKKAGEEAKPGFMENFDPYYPTERERILINSGLLNERTMCPVDKDNRPRYGKKVGFPGTEGDQSAVRHGKKKKLAMKVKGKGVGGNLSSTTRSGDKRKFTKNSPAGEGMGFHEDRLKDMEKFSYTGPGIRKLAVRTSQANQNIPNNPTRTGQGASHGLGGGGGKAGSSQDELAPKLKKMAKRVRGIRGEPSADNLSIIDKPREKSLAQKAGYKYPKEGKPTDIDSFGRKIGKLSGR